MHEKQVCKRLIDHGIFSFRLLRLSSSIIKGLLRNANKFVISSIVNDEHYKVNLYRPNMQGFSKVESSEIKVHNGIQ